LGSRFEGSGLRAAGSRIAIHKPTAKEYAEQAGVATIPPIIWNSGGSLSFAAISDQLGDDFIIKPVSEGSSRGLSIITSSRDWEEWLSNQEPESGEWLIEKRIHGREFSIGVLGEEALAVVEIQIPGHGIYDYEQKYLKTDTRYLCPAPIRKALEAEVQDAALRVFKCCGCRDFGRVDFLYDEVAQTLYFLEINTIPGMTPTSLLPKSAAACGYDFQALLGAMLKPCLERYRATEHE